MTSSTCLEKSLTDTIADTMAGRCACLFPGHTEALEGRVVPCGDGMAKVTLASVDAPWRVPTNPIGAAALSKITLRTWGGEKLTPAVERESTPRDAYMRIVGEVAERAGARGGKTVISRCITGTFIPGARENLTQALFGLFPGCFRFSFSHPQCGCWAGASPELLLHLDAQTLAIDTQALAGTRRRGTAEPWDAKNMEEHRLVVDDMLARLGACPGVADVRAGAPYSQGYGDIEHLCTPIRGRVADAGAFEATAMALHPTPAVGGWPRAEALADIRRYEPHSRGFYGGTVVSSDTAYVILRCVHYDADRWCVYVGSGITGNSRADDEWLETEAKAEALLRLLTTRR